MNRKCIGQLPMTQNRSNLPARQGPQTNTPKLHLVIVVEYINTLILAFYGLFYFFEYYFDVRTVDRYRFALVLLAVAYGYHYPFWFLYCYHDD